MHISPLITYYLYQANEKERIRYPFHPYINLFRMMQDFPNKGLIRDTQVEKLKQALILRNLF